MARSRKAKARGRAARILASAERLETLMERGEKVVEQIDKRLAGEPIEDRSRLPPPTRSGLPRAFIRGK